MKTIFERRKIYKKLLNDILTDEIYCKFGILYTGLCRMLRPNTMDDITMFPELMKHKPSRKSLHEYWWKEPYIKKIPFTHIKGFDCGHVHVVETEKLHYVDCHACIAHIQEDVELVKKRTDHRLQEERKRLKKVRKKLRKQYPNNPDCPKCGMRMVKRISKYGTFYGCSQYPNCKSTKSI